MSDDRGDDELANATIHSSSASAALPLPPVSPSAYTLGRELARGGMGRILEAHDLRAGRTVAVKQLLWTGQTVAARFQREARVTARLEHPGIVPIYEIGEWSDGTPFYAMRLIEGVTLGDALAGCRTLDERLAHLPSVIAAADAVAFAHSCGVIHRDLKPANVMLGEFGETLVIDWGLAKDLEDPMDLQDVEIGPYRDTPIVNDGLTAAGAVIGTASYMPPEQASGGTVDKRSDVYALGSILYHLLAGTPPYRGGDTDAVLAKLRAEPPRPVEQVVPGVPRDLSSIVTKAMARDPAGRYPTAKQLAEELRRFQTGRFVEAHVYSRGELVRRWLRRHRALAIGAIVLLVALGVTTLLWFRDVQGERRVAMAERDRATAEELETRAINRSLLEEQGRQYLLAGDHARALVYLDAAMQRGLDTPALRLMLGMARAAVDTRDIAFACPDNSVGSWRAAIEHGIPTTAAMTRDGARLVVMCDRKVLVWDVATHEIRLEHETDADFFVISPDDRWLALRGRTVTILDLATGSVHEELELENVRWIAFATNALFYVSTRDRIVVRDLARNAHVEEIPYSRERLLAIVAANGRLAVVGPLRIELHELGRQRSRTVTIDSPPVDGDLAADGRALLTCHADGRVIVWNTATARRRYSFTFADPTDSLSECRFDKTGRRLLVASSNGSVEIRDVETGTTTARLWVEPGVTRVLFVERLGAILLERLPGVLELRAESSGQPLAELTIPGRLRSLTPDERAIVVETVGGARLVPLAPQVRVFDPPPGHVAIAVDNNGDRVLLRSRSKGFTLWDTTRGSKIGAIEMHDSIVPRFAADGVHLIGALAADRIGIIDVRDGREVASFDVATRPESFGCDRTCTRVFVQGGSHVQIWDRNEQRPIATLQAFATGVLSLDGSRAAFFGAGGIYIWELPSGRLVGKTAAMGRPIGFDRNGRYLAIMSRALEVWDVERGQSVLFTSATSARLDESCELVTAYVNGSIVTWRFPDASRANAIEQVASAHVASPRIDHYVQAPTSSPDAQFTVDFSADAMIQVRAADGRLLANLGDGHTLHASAGLRAETPSPRWIGRDTVIGFGRGVGIWRLPFEQRSADEVHAFVERAVALRLDGDRVVPVTRPVRGRVTRGGSAFAGARVQGVMPPSDRTFVAYTDAEGRFEFTETPPGAELLVLAHTGDSSSRSYRMTSGEVEEIDLPMPRDVRPIPYSRELEIASPNTYMPASIAFHNRRSRPVEIYWITFEGTRLHGGVMHPGETHRHWSYERHRFVLREVDGPELGIAIADGVTRVIVD